MNRRELLIGAVVIPVVGAAGGGARRWAIRPVLGSSPLAYAWAVYDLDRGEREPYDWTAPMLARTESPDRSGYLLRRLRDWEVVFEWHPHLGSGMPALRAAGDEWAQIVDVDLEEARRRIEAKQLAWVGAMGAGA